MGDKRPYKPRKPGAGRKPLKPNYDAAAILQEQMEAAVALYTNNSLQTIADTLSLNPIKVRKLLITAGVYEPVSLKSNDTLPEMLFIMTALQRFNCFLPLPHSSRKQ